MMGSKPTTLQELIHHQLKDLYDSERHAGKLLFKMAKATTSAPLRQAFERRHDDRAAHLERLETLFGLIDKKAHGVPCAAMQGIVEETKTLIDDMDEGAVLDAGLIAAAEAMEHYALARYTALRRWTAKLDLAGGDTLIETTLTEARRATDRWAMLAGSLPLVEHPPAAEPLTLKGAALLGLG